MISLNYLNNVCSNVNLNNIILDCNGIQLSNGQTSASLPFSISSNMLTISTSDSALVGTFSIFMTYTLSDIGVTDEL